MTHRDVLQICRLYCKETSKYLVELKSHQSFDQRRLPAGLVPHDQHGRRVERLVEVLQGKETMRVR